MDAPLEPVEDLADALERGQFGFALLDERLAVRARIGRLSGWLPGEGEPACASPLLLHMEGSLAALRRGEGEIVLPSMRVPAESAARVNISIRWNGASGRFVVVTAPDHGGEQIERLLGSERREKQLLQQQAEAAAAKMRVADALYRDIVESSGDLVLRFGADLRIVFANRVAARFLGRAQDALAGQGVDRLFPPLGQNRPWRMDLCADGPASFETAARDAAGAIRWLWWDVRFSGAEGAGEFQAVARDVTEARRLRAERDKAREEAQEEARAAALAEQRLRIAHDLHDTLLRSIVTLIAQTRLIGKTTRDEEARVRLAELEAEARAGLREARQAVSQMRAAREEENDLRQIVAMFARRSRNGPRTDRGVDIQSEILVSPGELTRQTEELLARVLREALRNIELHSGARRVSVGLRREGQAVRLDILDDGVGFDPSAPAPGHFGVAGMRERAALAGATLDIASAPGEGTRVTLTAPIAEKEAERST